MGDFHASTVPQAGRKYDSVSTGEINMVVRHPVSRPPSYRETAVNIAHAAEGDCCFTLQNCGSLQARKHHKRSVIFHRTSPWSFWIAILILGIASIVGVFTPHLQAIDLEKGESKLAVNADTIDFTSGLFWLTWFTWSFKWYIQAILNFTRGCTIGLNIDYVLWGFVAALTHGLGVSIAAATNRKVASFDSRSVTIDLKMWIYILNGIISSGIVALQCWRYDGWDSQRPGALVRGVMVLCLIFTIFYLIVNMGLIQDDRGSEMAITRYIYACEIFALFCTVFKFIPQIMSVAHYGIWIGVDILALLFELIGAVSLCALILWSQIEVAPDPDTFRDILTVEIRQVVQTVFITLAVLILLVQLVYFWTMPTPEDMDARVNEKAAKQVGGNALRRPSVIAREMTAEHHKHHPRAPGQAPNGGHLVGSPPHAAGGQQPTSHTHMSRDINDNSSFAPSTPPLSGPSDGAGKSKSDSFNQNHLDKAFGTISTVAQKWKCPICTYSNEATNIYCAMCETPFEDVLDSLEAEKADLSGHV